MCCPVCKGSLHLEGAHTTDDMCNVGLMTCMHGVGGHVVNAMHTWGADDMMCVVSCMGLVVKA